MSITRMKTIVDEIRHLRPWPPVALRVVQLSREPAVLPNDLVEVLQTDAALTARVLKLCNSAYYGFQRQVASLQEAGNRLGSQALVHLVLTTCVERAFEGNSSITPARARRLWERSVMNALSASHLATIHGEVDRNVAYTAGLLCNFGHLVLDAHLEELRDEIQAYRSAGVDMLEAERAAVGLDHGQIAGRMMRRWNFPEALVDAVEHHHAPERAAVDPQLAAITHLGEAMTHAVALGEGLDGLAYQLSDKALGLTGLTQARLAALEDSLMAELQRARLIVQTAA